MSAGSSTNQQTERAAGEGSPSTAWPPQGWVEPRQTMIDVGKLELGALVYEPSAVSVAGPETIILLHGWADSAWSMDSVAQPLSTTHRVVNLDLRGHGRSGRGPYNMLHFIGDLRGVVEALDVEQPIVIGHSLGGQIATQFSGLFPESVRALVVVEGVGPPPHRLAATDPDGMERAYTRKHVERTRAESRARRLDRLADAVSRLQQAHPLLDPARAEFLADKNTIATDDGRLEWRFDPDSRDWFNGHNHVVAAQRWRGITCPVLVANGSDSHERYWRFISDDPEDYPEPLAGAALEERLSHFGDVRYAEIAGAGHMLPYDKPDKLNDVIADFLAGLDR